MNRYPILATRSPSNGAQPLRSGPSITESMARPNPPNRCPIDLIWATNGQINGCGLTSLARVKARWRRSPGTAAPLPACLHPTPQCSEPQPSACYTMREGGQTVCELLTSNHATPSPDHGDMRSAAVVVAPVNNLGGPGDEYFTARCRLPFPKSEEAQGHNPQGSSR
jgi:hypothetical protein